MTASAIVLVVGALVSCVGLVGELCRGAQGAVSARRGNAPSYCMPSPPSARAVIRAMLVVGPGLVLLSLALNFLGA